MGFRGIPTADFAIEDVKAPGENVIIGAGGFGKLMSAFGLERCGNATQALAVAAAALEQALEYENRYTERVSQLSDRLHPLLQDPYKMNNLLSLQLIGGVVSAFDAGDAKQ